ncbi:hypothetical protein E0Z10_g5397 [Xylaria hypoxylon]|uniref:Uncharacterized protein n=1 Tax=Xylaria hypoxylon TaxID=37992 RepID=A0A4Z0YTN0_9PEZI|nr:hypothetical protein E0Z10_g5397 [Xylaria hypoxylon]
MPHSSYLNGNKIIVLEDDDCNSAELSYIERGLCNFRNARQTGQSIPVIDLTQDEDEKRDVLEYEIQIISELDRAGRNNPNYRRRPTAPLRDPPIPMRSQMFSFRHKNMLMKPGTVVEVSQRPRDQHCWQFLHVHNIYTDNLSHNVVLCGIRLTRHRYLRGMLPRMKNEVCALYDVNKEDSRPEHIQAAVEILATEVTRTRAFSKTNDAFPAHRFNTGQWKTTEEIENKGVLVQRWKYCRYWPTSGAMATKKSLSGALVRLRSADIEDEHFRVPDDKLRNAFRGGIIHGGSLKGGRVCIPAINVDTAEYDQGSVATLGRNQKYTADDMFCGAGGASW